MISEQLTIAILKELNDEAINSLHNINKDNIDQLLVEPKIIELIDISKKIEKYWLVLNELPSDLQNGYLIVYDERNEMFGLATKTTMNYKNIGYLVGLYGSFIDALNNI